MTRHPVLIIGGYGVVGSRTARLLRDAHPDLALTIAGRDAGRAAALAGTLGPAQGCRVDLERPDLGLPAGAAFSAVLTLMKDETLNSLRFAQGRGIPYIAFSDFAFDIAPAVALAALHPGRSAVLMLGHFLGGTITMAAAQLARSFARVDAVEIAGLFDAADLGGGSAKADLARVPGAVPRPLLRQDGRWIWAGDGLARRDFRSHDGRLWQGEAAALLDTPSLAALTGADTVRVDLAVGPPASRLASGTLSHEVVIEIRGTLADGTPGRARWDLIDGAGYSAMSARGAALAIERLLDLDGDGPVAPGLYYPEMLLDADRVVARMQALGTLIMRS